MSLRRIVVKKYGKIKKQQYNNKNVVNENFSEKQEENFTEEKLPKNNKKKAKKDMVTEEQITSAENMAMDLNDTKVLKKDKGLIERTESSKIILTEDNRQLLND